MEVKNLAIIEGTRAKLDNGKLSYKAPSKRSGLKPPPSNRDKTGIENIILRSDQVFGNGILEFNIKAKSHNTGFIVRLTSSDNKMVRIGYSRLSSKFVISVETELKWNTLCSAGDFRNYSLNDELSVKIDIKGSLIKLIVNKVLLCETFLSIKDSPLELILGSDADFEFYGIKIKSVQAKIFVVMQFSKEYNELYEEVIKPVSESFNFQCIRADEFYTTTPILSDIISSIEESKAIIAEITPDNPNVFYEIGYSHAIRKPTILLCDKKREKLPFDLSSFRTLFYENTIAGKKKVEASLISYLENL